MSRAMEGQEAIDAQEFEERTRRRRERYEAEDAQESKVHKKQHKKEVCLEPGKHFFRAHPFWQEVLPAHVIEVPWLERGAGIANNGSEVNFAREPDGEGAASLKKNPIFVSEPIAVDDPQLLEAAVCVERREDEEVVTRVVRSMCSWGKKDKLRRLLASSFVTPKACEGALCEAARLGHEDVVQELLRARALPNAGDGVVGKTVLHYACEEGHEGVATMLIGARADITAKDKAGNTPCELARQKDMGMMAKRLEKHVASSLRNWLSADK